MYLFQRAQAIMDRKWAETLRRWRRRIINQPEAQREENVEMRIIQRRSRNPQVTNPTASTIVVPDLPSYDSHECQREQQCTQHIWIFGKDGSEQIDTLICAAGSCHCGFWVNLFNSCFLVFFHLPAQFSLYICKK